MRGPMANGLVLEGKGREGISMADFALRGSARFLSVTLRLDPKQLTGYHNGEWWRWWVESRYDTTTTGTAVSLGAEEDGWWMVDGGSGCGCGWWWTMDR